jgi:dihydroorotate dehydrogenase (fumarate)
MNRVTFGVLIRALLSVSLAVSILVFPNTNTSFAADATSSEEKDAIAVNPATNGEADPSRTRFDYQLNPGQPARDSIYIVNTGTSVQEVTVYARDAYSGSDGEFLIGDESSKSTDVGSWVIFEGNKETYNFSLKPGNFVTIPFTVFTPTDASPGDHAGAIVASAVSKGTDIDVVRRLAVRLYARISGQIKARLEISNLKSVSSINFLNPFEHKQTLTYDLENTGNIELSADVSAQSSGPLGLFAGEPENLRVSNLLPGSTRQVTQTVSGGGQFVATNTSVVFTGIFTSEGIDVQQPRGRQDFSSITFPTATLLYLGIIAVLVLGFALVKRRRKLRAQHVGPIDG